MLGRLEDVSNLYNELKEEKSTLDEKLADMEAELEVNCGNIEVFKVEVGSQNIFILNISFRCLLKSIQFTSSYSQCHLFYIFNIKFPILIALHAHYSTVLNLMTLD